MRAEAFSVEDDLRMSHFVVSATGLNILLVVTGASTVLVAAYFCALRLDCSPRELLSLPPAVIVNCFLACLSTLHMDFREQYYRHIGVHRSPTSISTPSFFPSLPEGVRRDRTVCGQ
ncbi:uncharacterized protein PHACADRAFT_260498 [Phanerochaete carnosa HHB-10118-sp]|uniref:Uncharacterized protein n=1 Tax=Phanerochaete carnosa (strain HHB-10118-sp) TaxID=650164 RepID=K5VZK0_PHACS|nr:uncharacterized protein PHACADRAFT_260498 [Phanerochaete carnosa HHB-10118-sp]EKM52260.1 hypothetical protein PHACADRAFT_260498 [Phanerochaete carnosa HHB-10118-sp]